MMFSSCQRQELDGPVAASDDLSIVRRAASGEAGAFRAIMQANNQRLYRIARSILRDDGEAEDALQDAYLRAFSALETFRGESSLRTWLSRIVINEALGRVRKRAGLKTPVGELRPAAEIIHFPLGDDDPERTMAQREILKLVERGIDDLPDVYRTVFVARVTENMSIGETADLLGLRPETVKTRLHRARLLLRRQLEEQIGPTSLDAFPFAGARCARVTDAVMRKLGFLG